MVSKKRLSIPLRLTMFILMGPLLTAGKCKQEPPEEPEKETTGDVQDITVQLQLVSVEPDTVQAQKRFAGLIFGAAFQEGARVQIGEQYAENVSVEDPTALSFSMDGLAAGTYDVAVFNPDGARSSLRQALTVETGIREDCRFVRVQFEFDKATLDAESRSELDGKMSCFQETSAKIRIEGHTDERGTVDYNLSLGQRRAEAVRRYFDASGVADFRLSTVSYGKERPVDSAHNESAWEKNRRADIHANQ